MVKRSTFLAFVIALLIVSGLVQAQGTTFCGTLSSADCDTLNASSAAMSKVTALTFHLDMRFSMEGIPGLTAEDFVFRLVGDGAYSLDPAKQAAAAKLLADAQKDPKKTSQYVEAVFRSFSADISAFVDLPDSLVELMRTGPDPIPTRIPFDLRMVDGIGYVNLDKISRLDKSGNVKGGWYGFDIAALERATLDQNPQAFGDFKPGAASDPSLIGKYMDVTRLSDTESNGQAMAVFQTTLSFTKLLALPGIGDALKSYLRTALARQGLSGSRIETMINDYISLFQSMTVDWSQTVGLDDKYVHHFEANWDWKPDMAALDRLSGGGSGLSAYNLDFKLKVNLDLDRFNDVPAITAPKGATIVPLSQIMPGMQSGTT